MKTMEEIIAKDLGISADEIRKTEWTKLERMPRGIGKIPFRPKHMFPVNGNINLALNREMGMNRLSLREFKRGVCYKFKCLLRNRKHV